MRHLVAMVMRDVVVTRKQIHIRQIYARRLTATDQMIKNPAVSTDMKIKVKANVNTPKIRGIIRTLWAPRATPETPRITLTEIVGPICASGRALGILK